MGSNRIFFQPELDSFIRFVLWNLRLDAVRRTCIHALGLDRGRQGYLLLLFFPVPPASRTLVFLVRTEEHVFAQCDPGCLGENYQPTNLAPVHRRSGNGMESRLVRPHGVDVYEHILLWAALVAISQADQAPGVVGINFVPDPDGH